VRSGKPYILAGVLESGHGGVQQPERQPGEIQRLFPTLLAGAETHSVARIPRVGDFDGKSIRAETG